MKTPWPDRALVITAPHPAFGHPLPASGEKGNRERWPFSAGSRWREAPRERQSLAAWFTPAELELASAFKLEKRRNEWLLSRIAAKELAIRLGIATDPHAVVIARPTLVIDGLQKDWYVSLSHSEPYAAAAIAREPIGLDIQVVREFPEQAAHLFLTEDEERAMESCTLRHCLLHFWCAKEAAWKRQQGEIPTLKRVPLELLDRLDDGLLFDAAETVAIDDVILAITRPTS